MVDSARLGAVVDEFTAGASELMVEGDRGGEAAEPGDDPFAQALQGPGTVTLEREDVFRGPDDRFDALADRREMRWLGRCAVTVRARVGRNLACGSERRGGNPGRSGDRFVAADRTDQQDVAVLHRGSEI